MRTTIRLDDALLADAKALAARTGRTLTKVIEDALRESLARGRPDGSRPEPVELPTFKGRGLQPGRGPRQLGGAARSDGRSCCSLTSTSWSTRTAKMPRTIPPTVSGSGDVLEADHAFAVSDLVLGGFLRVVTHPRVFDPPTLLSQAMRFVDAVRSRPNAVPVAPGPRHWGIFVRLCETAGVKGNLVPDAYLAALAIESGSEWITTDRDYTRFPRLRWRHPLARPQGASN